MFKIGDYCIGRCRSGRILVGRIEKGIATSDESSFPYSIKKYLFRLSELEKLTVLDIYLLLGDR